MQKQFKKNYNTTTNNNEKNESKGSVIDLFESLEKPIDEFLLECEKRSGDTAVNYRCDINKLARDMFNKTHYKYIQRNHLESISVDDLIQYFNAAYQEVTIEGKRKYSNSTINRRMSSLKSLIKYLVARKKIDYEINDMYTLLKSLPDKSIMIDVLSNEDTDRCIEYFKTLDSGNVLHLLGRLAVDTALRANELLTLEWNQFTITDDKVIISSRGANKGKGNKTWEDEISIKLYNELLALKTDDNNKVFDISYSTIARAMNKTTKALGLDDKKYTFHSFRKNAVTHTYLVTNGDILAAMDKANHTNVGTTQRYIKGKKRQMTGRYSMTSVCNDLYRDVSHEELLLAISKMDKSTQFQLNKLLSEIVETVKIETVAI